MVGEPRVSNELRDENSKYVRMCASVYIYGKGLNVFPPKYATHFSFSQLERK